MQVVRTGFQDGLQSRRRTERYGPGAESVHVQLLVYLLGSYSLLLGLALIVPLWLFYGFHLRKRYMLYGSGGACAEIRTTSSVRHSIFRLFRP